MANIKNIKLEILRSGPAHNQLLSPLTPYLAMCGQDGPVNVQFPFEQRQLLTRLERLRYYAGQEHIAANQREAELRDLGECLGQVLGQVPSLLVELGRVHTDQHNLVHLRLSLSAFEVALLPFECAIAQEGFPGSGSPLFLQTNTPVTLTREIRRGQQLPVAWNRPPRILFIYANPTGMARVPYEKHLLALRQAVAPWVAVKDGQEAQIAEVGKIITVLPEANLSQIRQVCMDKEFTHVHILAHGSTYNTAGDQRYGLALCRTDNPARTDVVDGERLALALTIDRATSCGAHRRPTMVTLATCDSGNVNSVLTPGGSIAHELHNAGIPWVIASQFPLWMRSSTLAVAILYKRILQGADPRCVLLELRQRLRTSCPETHDWASIVAYATVPWDFEKQVAVFQNEQTRALLETKLSRIDDLLNGVECATLTAERQTELRALCASIRVDLAEWLSGDSPKHDKADLAKRLGICGASEKRIGIALHKLAKETEGNAQKELEAAGREASYKACEYYRKAVDTNPGDPWLITQYLAMLAITDPATADAPPCLAEDNDSRHWWHVAREMLRRRMPTTTGQDRAWDRSSLAELELLGVVYNAEHFNVAAGMAEITARCQEIVQICDQDFFPVQSTRRQFRRYLKSWPSPKWQALAEAALAGLCDDKE